MKKIFLILILLFGSVCNGQNAKSFHTRFGSSGDEFGSGVVQALNGGYIIVGQTTGYGAMQTDILLTKTDTLGNPIWIKVFGGFNADVGKGLVELPDSDIVFVGYSNSYGNGGYDALIIRTDKNGVLKWRKTYGGLDWDYGYCINKTTDGNLIICGTTYSFGRGDKDGFILKMDLNGNFLWSKVYGGKREDDFKKIIQTNEGGYIATGTTKSYGDTLGNIWVAKFNSTGDSTWFVQRGGIKKEVGNSIVQDANNDYLICGGSESYTSGKEDAYIFKLANNNVFQYDQFIGVPTEDEEAYDLLNSGSTYGRVLLTWGQNSPATKLDILTMLLDPGFNYVRGGTFGSLSNDVGYSLFNTKDKGYIAAGYTEGFSAQLKDVFLVKYDSEMTIGPLIISVKEIQKNSTLRMYPTLVTEKNFIIETGDESSNSILLNVIDLNGNIVRGIKIENISPARYKVTLPEEVQGLILINLNNGELVRKCLVH